VGPGPDDGGGKGRRGPPLASGAVVRIYTRRGDDGTTGLLYGGRVPKHAPAIEVNGDVDEAQAMLGLARAEAVPGSELDGVLLDIERDLYVLMAEVATAPANRAKLTPGVSAVTSAMVGALEGRIDDVATRFAMPTEFVLPGGNRVSAALDVARTVVRRAERAASASPPAPDSAVGRYLNRLSDLLWMLARWQETEHVAARAHGPASAPSPRQDGGR